MPQPLTFAADRLPGFRTAAAWVGTLAVATVLLGAAELYWRSRGYLPFVPESRDLWAFHRSRVYGQKSVVLLGASRMRMGFSTDRFRERFPDHRIVQLAVDGRTPYATLCDLANDEDFHGLVICAITTGFSDAVTSNRGSQAGYVEHFHRWNSQDLLTKSATWNVWGNRVMLWLLQERLVIANPPASLRSLLAHLQLGTPFRSPDFATPRFDRSVLADYSKSKDLAALRRANLGPSELRGKFTDLQTWIRNTTQLKPTITRLQQRGARVVFVHFPLTDELARQQEGKYPKWKYWDRIAGLTGAATIHYREVPGMFGFEIPDMAHIDYRDSPEFTDALLDELVRRGLLPLERPPGD